MSAIDMINFGPLPTTVKAAGTRWGAGGPIHYTAEDFRTLADKFTQAVTLLLVERKLSEDDPMVREFMHYAEMCRQAARTEQRHQ